MKIKQLDLEKQYFDLKEEIDDSILRVLKSGRFILGEDVLCFEKELAEYLETDQGNVVSCASGSDALLLALMASGISAGDEVITTAFSFFATAGCIARLGAKPVFVDIDDDFNINYRLIEERITQRTKAVIGVDLYGLPCRQEEIRDICIKNKIKFISDSAQSIGSEINGKKVGTIADYTAFSFFPSKNLGCYGDGGAISVRNSADADLIRKLRVHGAIKKYYHYHLGINSRLDTLQACILRIKLKYLEQWTGTRRKLAGVYSRDLKNVKVPKHDRGHVYHQYTIYARERDKLAEHLAEHGISTSVYYPVPLHLQPCFEYLGYRKGSLLNSETASEMVLSLPIHENLTEMDVEYVAETLNSANL